LVVAALLGTAGTALAGPPPPIDAIGVDEKLGGQIPLDAAFRDSLGNPVDLGDYVTGDVPVLLTLNYTNCPQLCSVLLEGLVEVLKELAWTAGQGQFRVVTLSIDPKETPDAAAAAKARYIAAYGRPEAATGWHFLVGDEGSIRTVADAVGFRYAYDAEADQYLHPAAVVVVSPKGVITRYLMGVLYDERTLRLSLSEASEGRVGSPSDQVALLCYRYDPKTGRYVLAAYRLLNVVSVAAVIALAALLTVLWRRERRA
jgi:protein SCO1/2